VRLGCAEHLGGESYGAWLAFGRDGGAALGAAVVASAEVVATGLAEALRDQGAGFAISDTLGGEMKKGGGRGSEGERPIWNDEGVAMVVFVADGAGYEHGNPYH